MWSDETAQAENTQLKLAMIRGDAAPLRSFRQAGGGAVWSGPRGWRFGRTVGAIECSHRFDLEAEPHVVAMWQRFHGDPVASNNKERAANGKAATRLSGPTAPSTQGRWPVRRTSWVFEPKRARSTAPRPCTPITIRSDSRSRARRSISVDGRPCFTTTSTSHQSRTAVGTSACSRRAHAASAFASIAPKFRLPISSYVAQLGRHIDDMEQGQRRVGVLGE